MKIEVPIDHGHDSFIVSLETEDSPEVKIELWSRGTFGVEINLTAEDAVCFAAALKDVADGR